MNDGCQSCQDRLLDLLYGELDAAGEAEVRSHLAGCEDCADALAELGATRSLMEQLPSEEPSRGMEAILQAAEREARLRAAAQEEAPGLLARLGGWLRLHPVGMTLALGATVLVLMLSVDLDEEQARLGEPALTETAAAPAPAAPAAAAPAPRTTTELPAAAAPDPAPVADTGALEDGLLAAD
ncbi:MAG: zf-HC2 domain-containing protein, partial [Deltaproteobacteria bacterium]|nr:zf-HC2 domain-containing protein [Deltaproteobacteria bacterium]